MAFLDFDYLIVSNGCFSEESLSHTLQLFSELGIRKFIFTLDMDMNCHTFTRQRERLKLLQELVKPLRPRGVSFEVCTNLIMTEDVCYHPQVSRLCVPHTNLLFLQLPYFTDENWIHVDLNHLLRKKRISPIFTSFQNNLRTNPPDMLERCLNSQCYRFAMDLNYLTALDSDMLLRRIVREKIPVLPCISHDWSYYVGALAAFEQLRNSLDNWRYLHLCRIIRLSGQKLISNL